ncbi:Histone-lysine N-methyltransferase SMYD3 [Pseudocercospora fuligena]|uniref:Histone-lysine N-methyltransferase SMYD3 n=1 Tax=Pseudocercospora fuligena TaxID=685502 RepID=A0A8H6VIX8_9PEZI|nr:Histone-lysine N-methyltransferase SMYD3 [Pseudocercospora fuligena]
MIESWQDRQEKQLILEQVREAYKRLQQLTPTLQGKPRREIAATDRTELLEFLKTASKQPSAPGIKAFIVEKPYPPCTIPLDALDTIAISDMLLETHHVDKALIVRRIGPVWSTAVGGTYGVEDEEGNVDFLSFDGFNFPGDEVIPPNAIFAIKQPYCKVDTAGKPRIKVSHPTDLVLLPSQDERIPLTWRLWSIALSGEPSSEAEENYEQGVEELDLKSYDFDKIGAGLSKAQPRVDIGSYFRRVEIRPSPGRGRGLFATENIKMGDIVLVEKATFVTYNHEPQAYPAIKFDIGRNMITEDTRGAPYKDLARYLLKNSEARAKIFDLHSGSVAAPSPSELVDGKPIIDIFHLHEVWQNNAIACPTPTDVNNRAFPFRNTVSTDTGSGLWCHTSYANHSCIPNAEKSIIGDLVVLRANRDIERREEVTISYGEYTDQEDKQQAFDMVWGFRCKCELCEAEGAISRGEHSRNTVESDHTNHLTDDQETREKLRANFTEPLPEDITETNTLASDLNATYGPTYPNIPRLAVAEAHSRLFALHSKLRDAKRAEEDMLKVLNAVGLHLDENMHLLPTSKPLLDEDTVLNVSILADLVKKRMDEDAAKSLEDLAKKLYIILNGCMTGYENMQVDTDAALELFTPQSTS